MHSICLLAIISLALINCTGSGDSEEIKHRSNPGIESLLANTTVVTLGNCRALRVNLRVPSR